MELEIDRHQRPEDRRERHAAAQDAPRQDRFDPCEDEAVQPADDRGDGHVERAVGKHERQRLHLEEHRNHLRTLQIALEKERGAQAKEKDVAHDTGENESDGSAAECSQQFFG
ncbi:MAG: hypothetical protein V2I65_15185 [Paracoccaceae bacterium]|nr:hypothetical protein [Paracoccaceae bacterium]